MLNLQIVAVVNASCCNGAQRYKHFLNWKNFWNFFINNYEKSAHFMSLL